MFRLFRDKATVHRQTYVGSKSSFSPTGQTCLGYLRVLSPEKQQTSIEKYGKEYAYVTKLDADIRESDKLEINGITYRVKAVGTYRGINVNYTRAIIVKE